LILFSDQVELFIPPKKGKSHVLRIIRELIQFEPKSTQTNIGVALKFLSQVMKKKTIAFVVSDFMDDEKEYNQTLKIVAKKHDITGIKVNDIREKEMPNVGFVWMEDAESGQGMYVNTSDASVRNQYEAHFMEQDQYFKNTFARSGAGVIHLFTHDSYVKKLLAYFKAR